LPRPKNEDMGAHSGEDAKGEVGKGDRRRLPPGAMISFVGLYIGVVLNYVLNLLLARELGASEFGLVALGLSLVNLLGTAAQFGFSQGSSRFIGAYLARDEQAEMRGLLRTMQWIPLVFGALIAAAVVLFARVVMEPGHTRDVVVIAGLAVPVFGSLMLTQNVARAFGHMLTATLPMYVLLPSLAIASLYLGPHAAADGPAFLGYYAAIALALAAGVALTLNVRLRRQLPRIDPRYEFREWFGVARTMLATAFAQQYLRRIDVILLALFVRPDILGMYSLGSRFAQVLAVARFSVNRFWMPRVARRFAAGDDAGLQAEVTMAARLVFATTAVATVGLLLVGPYLIEFAGFEEGIAFQAMAILLLGQLVAGYYSPSVQTLQMCGHERSANRLVLLSALLVTVAVGVLGASAGALAAAAGVAAVTGLQFWLADRRSRQLVGVVTAAW
jgi:O-antigen/teichoic acid export membrane protein